MARVAILHYTLAPAIGGIERLIQEQCSALLGLGHEVRLVAGAGDSPPDIETRIIERMLPSHSEAAHALNAGDSRSIAHLAAQLQPELDEALWDCDCAWVHNLFTLGLHPALAVALRTCIAKRSEIRWTVWCEDVSGTSRYWAGPVDPVALPAQARYVTISAARSWELAPHLPPNTPIEVVSPPVDAVGTIGGTDQTRTLVQRTRLLNATPVIFVPAKLLPHKRLDVAVRAVARLHAERRDPLLLISGSPSPHQPELSAEVGMELRALGRRLGLDDQLVVIADMLPNIPSEATIRDLMLLSDLVFLPSAEEGFGLPLREAALLRTPIVCTDIPAFREAAPGATFVAIDASDLAVARALLEVSALPVNAARWEAVQSQLRFRNQISAFMDVDLGW